MPDVQSHPNKSYLQRGWLILNEQLLRELRGRAGRTVLIRRIPYIHGRTWALAILRRVENIEANGSVRSRAALAGDAIDIAADAIEKLASDASYYGTEREVELLLELAGDVRSIARGGRVVHV